MSLTAIVVFTVLVTVNAVDEQLRSDQLLGRPDGHELYERNDSRPLIGRPDGHEFYKRNESRPLIGRPDGHEPGVPARGSDDSSEDTVNYDDVDDDDEEDDDDDDELEYYPDNDDIYDDEYDTADDEDDDSYDDDYDTADDDEDADKPLVRCKRPICEMFCNNGFKTDANGCPICQCAPPQSDVNCDERPTCRMYCELGFQRDSDGCEVCQCMSDPCQDVSCDAGSECRPVPCDNLHSCTQLQAKCVVVKPSTRPVCRGAEPMCANACPSGYKYKDDGCMTCDCADVSDVKSGPTTRRCDGPQPMCAKYCPDGYVHDENGCMTCDCVSAVSSCANKTCDEGLVCRRRTVHNQQVSICSVKTACEIQREQPVGLGGVKPDCEDDGSFKPLQCDAEQSMCWCVDGLGRQLPDTRTDVYIDEHKPNCVRNNTVAMHIHMTLIVERHIDITHQMDSLTMTIVEHVSSWLLVERHYVKVVKTESQKPGDDDADSRSTVVVVELVVVHDGVSDLPSAGDYMKQQMKKGRCNIPFHGGSLKPDPDSVQVQHKFADDQQPHYQISAMEPYWSGLRLTLCAIGALLLVLLIVAIAGTIEKRRRGRLARQFRHQKLSASSISEKDLLSDEDFRGPVVVVADGKVKDKQPVV